VNQIKLPSGQVVNNPNEVTKIVIQKLKKIQLTSLELSQLFLYIPEGECRKVMSLISSDKALAFDSTSGILLQLGLHSQQSHSLPKLSHFSRQILP